MNAFRRITPAGAGVLVLGIAFGILAVVLRYPELAVVAVASLAAILSALPAVLRGAVFEARLEVLPVRARRGEDAVAQLTLVRRRGRGGLLEVLLHQQSAGASVALWAPPPGASRVLTIPLTTAKRGAVSVGPVDIRWTDALGLLTGSQRVAVEATVYVHPAVHTVNPLPSLRTTSPVGLSLDSVVDSGTTFNRLREYVPGDDPRRIHWRSSARASTLLVSLHADPSGSVSTVVLDTTGAAYAPGAEGSEEFETAVEVAASVLSASLRLRSPARLRSSGVLRLHCQGRRGDETRALDALSSVRLDIGERSGEALSRAVRAARGGSGTLVVVTGSQDRGQVAAAEKVARSFEQLLLVRCGRGRASAGGGPDGRHGSGLRVLDVWAGADLADVWPAAGVHT